MIWAWAITELGEKSEASLQELDVIPLKNLKVEIEKMDQDFDEALRYKREELGVQNKVLEGTAKAMNIKEVDHSDDAPARDASCNSGSKNADETARKEEKLEHLSGELISKEEGGVETERVNTLAETGEQDWEVKDKKEGERFSGVSGTHKGGLSLENTSDGKRHGGDAGPETLGDIPKIESDAKSELSPKRPIFPISSSSSKSEPFRELPFFEPEPFPTREGSYLEAKSLRNSKTFRMRANEDGIQDGTTYEEKVALSWGRYLLRGSSTQLTPRRMKPPLMWKFLQLGRTSLSEKSRTFLKEKYERSL
ncbi:uncharacterized protein BDR25DRAFT_317788 [Lindgomyces ingoldianus]|uniref:Uncharacterized protein n=1 Tax=Lindgomyces ingoldianus TaxID=673940 RepID=A0ACB6QHC5_9PLEO|nr:uncharacterized protein BDR25DRAFT_317788 [Lindgomyces ingoldianus]KAF2466409.1 hypothetical protein BDR25DRAFT_317788 [Lindgomyces ingoldianus]